MKEHAFFKLCEGAFSTKWLQPGQLQHEHGWIEGPPCDNGIYRLRFICSLNIKHLSVSLCGGAQGLNSPALYVLRVLTTPGYNDIVVPFFYGGYNSDPLFNLTINDLVHPNNPFLVVDDDPEYRQVKAQAERASEDRCTFGFKLQLVLAGLSCTTRCFKDDMEIRGDPVLSHGFAWYLLAKYDGADNDSGDVDFGVELMPSKYGFSCGFSPVRCVGSLIFGTVQLEIDVDVTRTQATTSLSTFPNSFYPFGKVPLEKILDHLRLDETFAVIVAVTVTDEERRPDTKRIRKDAVSGASLDITQGSTIDESSVLQSQSYFPSHQPSPLPEASHHTFVFDPTIDVDVDGCTSKSASQISYYSPGEVHKNFTEPKGLVMIINNFLFRTLPNAEFVYGNRHGTDIDASNIGSLLRNLGYEVLEKYIHTDLDADTMLIEAEKFAQDERHSRCHSCVVVALTHGGENVLIGSDSKPVNITAFVDCFNPVNAKGLAGKPKVFIFQACRGKERDPGVVHEVTDNWFTCIRTPKCPSDQHHTATTSAPPPGELPTTSASMRPSEITLSALQVQAMAAKAESLPESADILIAYATPLKYVSWRHPKEGSVFIKTICDVFGQHAKSESLEDMLKMVLRKIAENYKARREGYKQMPCYECRLRKKFYFFPNVTSE